MKLWTALFAIVLLLMSMAAFAVTGSSCVIRSGGIKCTGGDFILENTSGTDRFTVKKNTGVLSAVPTSTTGTAWTLDTRLLTTGDALKLMYFSSPLNGGKLINIYGGASGTTSVWTVGENGVTIITPDVATASPFYINGTVTTTGDLVTLKAVDATLDGGYYLKMLGGTGSTTVASIQEGGAGTLAGGYGSTGISWTADGNLSTNGTLTVDNTTNLQGLTTLGTAACGTEALLLGAGAKSGGEATTALANKNFVDFRCASTATSGWAHAGAFYIKAQDYGLSASALRGYAYADAPSGASTGEISGVYGIGEQHGAGTISATGKLMGMRSRVTVPSGLTLTTGNYYGLLIETDLQSTVANATNSAYIKIDDPNQRGKWLTYFLDIAHGDVGTATSNMVKTNLGDAATAAGLKIVINGTPYWIQLATYSP